MYFSSRMQAGRMLASQLAKRYRYENCVVVALDDGGVVIGAQIAQQLHCLITLMLAEEITLPREMRAIGGIVANGKFSYNTDYSVGEIDEFLSEYRSYIDEERLQKFHVINQADARGGLIRPEMLKHHNVILVSEGLWSGMKLDLAAEILKPIEIESLIVATPLASVPAVDKIHVLADAVYCLSVIDDPMETDHYYEKKDIPEHAQVIKIIQDIILKWK